MCDYCGCRDAAAIDELSIEHEQVLDLVYSLRRHAQQREHDRAGQVAAALSELLAIHTAKEEEGLFSELRASWGADPRLDELAREHRYIDHLVTSVARGRPGWEEAALRLADTLSDHVMAEETDLFPYALYELRDAAWARIDAIHRRLAAADRADPAA